MVRVNRKSPLTSRIVQCLNICGSPCDSRCEVGERKLVFRLVDETVRLARASDEAGRVVEALAYQTSAQDGVAVLIGRAIEDRFRPKDARCDPNRRHRLAGLLQ